MAHPPGDERRLLSRDWSRAAMVAAIAWVGAGTLFGDFTTFIAFDHRALGRAVLEGAVPYRDFTFEYPPGAALVLAAPATAGREAYDVVFRLIMLGTWTSVLAMLARREPGARSGFLAASVALTFVIGAGFDIIVTLTITAAYFATTRAAHLRAAWLIAAGILTKLVPVVITPLLGRAMPRRSRIPQGLSAYVIVGAALLASVLVPSLIARPGDDPLTYHSGRLLHAESTIGSAVALTRDLTTAEYPIVFDHGSRSIAGTAVAQKVSLGLLAVALVVLWTRGAPTDPSTWVATLLAIPALGPVASPQFLLWPLGLIGLLERGQRLAFTVAGVLSALMFTGPHPGEGTLLLALTVLRNLALLTAFASIFRSALQRPLRSGR